MSPSASRGGAVIRLILMSHRPRHAIVTGRVVRVGLFGVPVHQRAVVERVAGAAHFVLDGEQRLAAGGIDDLLEAILVLVAFLGDEPPLGEAAVQTREIPDVDLDVVAVIGRQRPVALAIDEVLPAADRVPLLAPGLVPAYGPRRHEDFALEPLAA